MTIWTIIGFLALLVFHKVTIKVFYEKRRTSLRMMALLYLLAFASLLTIGLLTWGVSPHIHAVGWILSMIIPSFIMSLNYESLLIKRLSVALCGFLLHYISNIFLMPIFFIAYDLNNVDLEPFGGLIIAGLACLIAALLSLFFRNIKKDFINQSRVWIPAIVVPIVIVSLTFYQSFDLSDAFLFLYIEWVHTGVIILGCVILTFSLYNVIADVYENKLKSALNARDKEYYFTQCNLMQDSVNNMKAYRHDVKLHLAALKGITDGNQEAANYIDKLLGGVEKSEVYSDTGNIAFDSIINFKLKEILTQHINLQLKVFVPPALNIEVSDVVTILGNLLDNAFEAVNNVEDKMIKLTVEVTKGVLFIKLDNTYDGVVEYIDSKNELNEAIATRKDGDNHGYGLKNIQKSVDKYNGQMDISHDDNIFSVRILLYVDGM